MTMTKKDYLALANILKNHWSRQMICFKIANYCEESNPKFKRDTFLSDCGVVE